MMYHTRPRYFTLGDLQATLKPFYLWNGPTDHTYTNYSNSYSCSIADTQALPV